MHSAALVTVRPQNNDLRVTVPRDMELDISEIAEAMSRQVVHFRQRRDQFLVLADPEETLDTLSSYVVAILTTFNLMTVSHDENHNVDMRLNDVYRQMLE